MWCFSKELPTKIATNAAKLPSTWNARNHGAVEMPWWKKMKWLKFWKLKNTPHDMLGNFTVWRCFQKLRWQAAVPGFATTHFQQTFVQIGKQKLIKKMQRTVNDHISHMSSHPAPISTKQVWKFDWKTKKEGGNGEGQIGKKHDLRINVVFRCVRIVCYVKKSVCVEYLWHCCVTACVRVWYFVCVCDFCVWFCVYVCHNALRVGVAWQCCV